MFSNVYKIRKNGGKRALFSGGRMEAAPSFCQNFPKTGRFE